MPQFTIACGNLNCPAHAHYLCDVTKPGELANLLRDECWLPLDTGDPNSKLWLCPLCAEIWHKHNDKRTAPPPEPGWPQQQP